MDIMTIGLTVLALVIGAALGYVLQSRATTKRIGDADELAKRIVEEARKEAQAQKKEILIQGQNDLYNQKREQENEFKEREREIKNRERKLEEMGERLEERLGKATEKEHELLATEKNLARKERQLEENEEYLQTRIEEQEQRLSEIAGLTPDEARERLLADIEARTRHESARMIRQIETEARETADRKAKEILCSVIQRYAGDYVNEQTVTAVSLPSEDMKGRIIGREGRNIRALESATGVDLIIDDTPETVILSAYSPLRRQVAKMALERLIQDGRIHPARIEDIVQKCEQELDTQVREVGEQATFDAGVHGIHPEIVRLLGQLRYRTSFTQNVLQHSLEVSALCGMMAAELGMDVKKAKRAGLLHDIGKAVDHEVEGPHAIIGADIAKKYNEGKDIVHAIAAHHEDQRPSTALAVLVQAADSISGARPGARKELLENYVKRLEDLENIATSFDGVAKAYAIQAGREIRVMVNPESVDDDSTYLLCKDIAEKIEKNLTYPGQIRVTVIRERRASGFAK
ncbi:ribonuclease Y [uncultured Desulfovibrio sp.]|uniref:Ribonuclease Y n=1 Tax=Candidatus Desulfovibrio intestinavium TaxID=2838534 RepID=A0A9D2KSW0_9BACT|nr:ribonuclease Y [uncultured Desulfovibrio sp.]HJA79831.1 ribonuclease Y [Candidatus Desulfovibrio intestinavium]